MSQSTKRERRFTTVPLEPNYSQESADFLLARLTSSTDGVFVFGSNTRGYHGAGAARFAVTYYDAVQGAGRGPTGRAYALPTKDHRLRPLMLGEINFYLEEFVDYARGLPETQFLFTPVGTGFAGHRREHILELLISWDPPVNIRLKGW